MNRGRGLSVLKVTGVSNQLSRTPIGGTVAHASTSRGRATRLEGGAGTQKPLVKTLAADRLTTANRTKGERRRKGGVE